MTNNLVPSRHWYGFLLSLLTAVLWGVLPVFIKLCLAVMDAFTLTWYRFAVAGVFVFLLLAKKGALPNMSRLLIKNKIWLLVASVFLVLNYVSNVKGLEYLNPETTQVVMQLAPFFLMLGGIAFYAERFTRFEQAGAVMLFLGLVLFFHDRMEQLLGSLNQFSLGVLIVVFAATTWAAYALLQKLLLRVLTAKQLTLCIYLLGVVLLAPFVDLGQLFSMNTLQLGALIFCCVNTIIAYGAFTEAMGVWQASKVSAVIATAPLYTFGSMQLAVLIWPNELVASDLDHWAYIGAGAVIVGSALTSLGRAK